MTDRETILQALHTLLQTIAGVTVLRNEIVPQKIPASGLLILRDGDTGEPEVTLSPISYYWNHRAVVEAVYQNGNPTLRDAGLDQLYKKIAAAVASDNTLGGLCDRVVPQAPESADSAIEGAAAIKGATIPILLIYATTDQLG